MRPTVRPLARFLEPGAPTGLAGLYTHPAPRLTLIYLYSSILHKLQQVPAHSPYRQATEALTKKRLAIIEAAKPNGFDAWEERVKVQLSQHQKLFGDENNTSQDHLTYDGRSFIMARLYKTEVDEREKEAEWDGKDEGHTEEGPRTAEVRDKNLADMYRVESTVLAELPKLEPEPLLTREQIRELEEKIGAGLIEEVIQVAEGENKLVDTMVENRVWEPLCEQPPPGQWSYFERGTHTNDQKS